MNPAEPYTGRGVRCDPTRASHRLAPMNESYRIGEAAKLLGVRVETLRRWEREGTLRVERTDGGQRLVPAAEVARVLAERHGQETFAAGSARNRFPGVITEVKREGLAATVEIQAGPHRVLAFITREAADQMGLEPGMEAIATVKATSVMVNLPED
jgi:molybdopterin-binding protein